MQQSKQPVPESRTRFCRCRIGSEIAGPGVTVQCERIEEMISSLKKIPRTPPSHEGSKELVEQGSKMVTETVQAFKKIQRQSETAIQTEVAAATEEQAATTEEITASVHEVANLIERTAKEAGDAAAATEESAAAIDEITRMIQTVNDTAIQAMEANKKFKVD